jgi:hypothetical protein
VIRFSHNGKGQTMKTKTLTLTTDEIATLNIALLGWRVRCKTEAAIMEGWAADHHRDRVTRDQCAKNAAASRAFEAAATALLAKI